MTQTNQSQHVETVGRRLWNLEAQCVTRRSTTDTNGNWFEVIKFCDADGNIYRWHSDTAPFFKVGDDLLIIGTVSEHLEEDGVKETQLVRVIVQPSVSKK